MALSVMTLMPGRPPLRPPAPGPALAIELLLLFLPGDEKDDLRLKEPLRSLVSTFRCGGCWSDCCAPGSPELVPGRDLLLLLLLRLLLELPPKKFEEEKKGVAFCVGVLPALCMAAGASGVGSLFTAW